jgi:hypothetical protein
MKLNKREKRNLIKIISEYLMFVTAGVSGGFVVAIITDFRVEERWGDSKMLITLPFILVFLFIFFILYLIFKGMNKCPEILEKLK